MLLTTASVSFALDFQVGVNDEYDRPLEGALVTILMLNDRPLTSPIYALQANSNSAGKANFSIPAGYVPKTGQILKSGYASFFYKISTISPGGLLASEQHKLPRLTNLPERLLSPGVAAAVTVRVVESSGTGLPKPSVGATVVAVMDSINGLPVKDISDGYMGLEAGKYYGGCRTTNASGATGFFFPGQVGSRTSSHIIIDAFKKGYYLRRSKGMDVSAGATETLELIAIPALK